jgi:uncharacterized membrane protein YccC
MPILITCKRSQKASRVNCGITEYKLARKDVYVNSANLSATFERMTSEPKSKQRNIKELHKFVVLNHILASYSANIASALIRSGQKAPHADMLKLVKRSIAVLKETEKKLDGGNITPAVAPPKTDIAAKPEVAPVPLTEEDVLMKDQLGFINKIALDITKVTDNVLR